MAGLYRLTQGKHRRWENEVWALYTAGDVFEPTEAELTAFGDRLEPVPMAQSEAAPEEEILPASEFEPEPDETPEPEPQKGKGKGR